MSFSSLAKAAAAQMPRHNDESRAMLYGMLVFSHTFSENEISFRTETAEVSDIFCGLLLGELDIMVSPEMYQREINIIYRVKISDSAALLKIKEAFAQNGYASLDRSIVSSPRALAAFLKGAFISCGYVNPPSKPYRLDFTVKDADLAVELAVILSQELGTMPKLSVRKSYQVVYYRDSELIVDFLNLIGLTSTAFAIMNGQIEREPKAVTQDDDFAFRSTHGISGGTRRSLVEHGVLIVRQQLTGIFDPFPVRPSYIIVNQ